LKIHRLVAHPARPARRVKGVNVTTRFLPEGELMLRWRIEGARDLVLPAYSGAGRGDDLWKTTCFELFIAHAGGAYREFNFSPSGRWAAYDFSSFRQSEGNSDLRDSPHVSVERGEEITVATVRVPIDALGGARRGALTAVIEEEGGVTSFWAPAHGGDQPDFHDHSCFTLDFVPPLER
jgi:hypothetical protein